MRLVGGWVGRTQRTMDPPLNRCEVSGVLYLPASPLHEQKINGVQTEAAMTQGGLNATRSGQGRTNGLGFTHGLMGCKS